MSTVTDTTPEYDFGYSDNGPFMGTDGRVTRKSDGATIKINTRDYGRYMGVEVKDRDGAYSLDDLPEDVQAMAEDLKAHGGRYTYPYENATAIDVLYERAREVWWVDANELAGDYGFNGVYSDGRSGGWCMVQGTGDLAGDFRSDYGDPLCYYCGIAKSDHCNEEGHTHDHDFEPEVTTEEDRNNFLALAFDLVANITYIRTEMLADMIRDEHAELEYNRDANTIRGDN